MTIDPAVLRAMQAAGASIDVIIAAVEADIALVEEKKAAKRANNAERQRRFKAARKAEVTSDNAGNALPSVTNAAPPAPSFPPTPPNTPTPVSNNTRAQSGTRLAADFEVPEDWIQWAMKERGWSRTDSETEAANFVDYWHAKPGRDGRKSDWPATWRNWVRNSRRAVVPIARSGAPPPGKTLAEQILERQAVRA